MLWQGYSRLADDTDAASTLTNKEKLCPTLM